MSAEPKRISDRVSFKRTDDELTVIITQQTTPLYLTLMILWVALWVFVGVVFIYNWQTTADQNERFFYAVCSAFWAYFLVKGGKVVAWRLYGKEMLRVFETELSIKNAFGTYGKAQFYATENIQKFGTITYDSTKFFQFMERAPWIMGGETIGFQYLRKRIQFGKQLDDKEAKELARIIDKALREIPARTKKKLADN